MNRTLLLVLSGVAFGLVALTLGWFGNPANMGICVACFVRDIAGGLKLHANPTVQYMRPEIFGVILGAFMTSIAFKEFKASAGSAPFIRFALGFFMMLGCLVFLGCPLRMALRIGAGDLNAVIGLFGLVAGIAVGTYFINKGFSLTAAKSQQKIEGWLFPVASVILFAIVLWKSDIFVSSAKGPGSFHAPIFMALAGGLILGFIVQRTRFCFIGMAKHVFLTRNFGMALGVLALIVTVFIGSHLLGTFHLGFDNQPIAHNDGLWNFLSMALVGFCGVLITGCPLRQLVKAGQGDADSAMSAFGMLFGAAIAHNFSFASSPAGPTDNGKVIVIIGILVCFAVAIAYSAFIKKEQVQVE